MRSHTLALSFLLLVSGASGAEVHTLEIDLSTGAAEVVVPDPDFGQVEFGKDVDGDGRKDHTWCGEVAALTVYNVAVARGIWEPVLGETLTPEGLETAEAEFERSTGLKTESDRDAGIYPYTILAVAGGNVGVIAWKSKESPDPGRKLHMLHAVVVLGATEDGTEFVVKDCSFLDPVNPANPIADYMDYMGIGRKYLVWKMVPVINAAAEANARSSNPSPPSVYPPVPPPPWALPPRPGYDWNTVIAYFPLPRSLDELPRELAWLREKLREVKRYSWHVGGRTVEVTVYEYGVSSVEELVDVIRRLALAGIPVVCMIDLPLGAHSTDETPPPEFMKEHGWECGCVGMEILERVKGKGDSGTVDEGSENGREEPSGRGGEGQRSESGSQGGGTPKGGSATGSDGKKRENGSGEGYTDSGSKRPSESGEPGRRGERSEGSTPSGETPRSSSERKPSRRGVPVSTVAVVAVVVQLVPRVRRPG